MVILCGLGRDNCKSITSDGSVYMTGRSSRVEKRMKEAAGQDIVWNHSFINWQALGCKGIPPEFYNVLYFTTDNKLNSSFLIRCALTWWNTCTLCVIQNYAVLQRHSSNQSLWTEKLNECFPAPEKSPLAEKSKSFPGTAGCCHFSSATVCVFLIMELCLSVACICCWIRSGIEWQEEKYQISQDFNFYHDMMNVYHSFGLMLNLSISCIRSNALWWSISFNTFLIWNI